MYANSCVAMKSVFCCTILVTFAAAAGRERRKQLKRAQKILLASATFEDGKLMVLPDGTLPMKIITDTFSERVCTSETGQSMAYILSRDAYIWYLVIRRKLWQAPSRVPLDLPHITKLESRCRPTP
jgi:hypothetical protein